jgi:hypothetical protein
MDVEETLEGFVEEGRDDYVGLWEIVRAVREDFGVQDDGEVKRTSLGLIQQLLCHYGMSAGVPTPDGRGFVPWPLSTDETLRRIETEWVALGRDPDIWEIVWFVTPEASVAHNDQRLSRDDAD